MRNQTLPNGMLTDDELQDPEILDLLRVFEDVDLLEALYPFFYELRDTLFTELVEKAGNRGPGRGLSVRLRNELDMTESAVKAAKLRTRRKRTADEQMDEKKAKAISQALRAAALAYRQAMGRQTESSDAS